MNTPPGIESRQSNAGIDFYLTSQGNHFMAEIAQMFQEGFEKLGLEASLRIDEIPPMDVPRNRLQVLVAPHELIPLFLAGKLSRKELRAAIAGCFLLNTEQPGSTWFETAFKFAANARGVFDINQQGVREFQRRGLPALHTPLGYTPLLEQQPAGIEGGDAEKEVDIVFLGHHSPRRASFLAKYTDALTEFDCRLILVDLERPRLSATPNVLAAPARNRLLQRSRILINVHSTSRKYFEWHRVLCAMANRCLVISEESEFYEPLVDGQHLILAGADDILDRCRHYLREKAQRQAITRHAYGFLRSALPIEGACRVMLQAQRAPPVTPAVADQRAGSWAGVRQLREVARDTAWRLRSTGPLVRRLPGQCKSFLRQQPFTHHLYYRLRSSYGRLRGRWSLEEIERRRRAIIVRLNSTRQQPAEEQEPPYRLLANEYYHQAIHPSISVIATVYNYGQFVTECLQSVARSQSDHLPGGLELIVIDDASTDDSAEVVQNTIQRSTIPACLVRKSYNTGVAEARNLGIRLARSPLVFILDGDNYIYPTCLSKLYNALRRSNAAGAYGIINRFDDRTGKGLGLFSWTAWDVGRLIAGPYIDGMALLDRQKVLSVGGYSTDLVHYGWFGWEDYDLWLKFARANYCCEFHPEILAAYRVHGASMIHVTQHYKRRLASYFREEFSDVLRRYPPGRMQFGSPAVSDRFAA